MRRHGTFGIITGVFFISTVFSQQARIVTIVDTDMGLDDARALALLLCSPNIEIKAIVTSDGSSSPDEGYINILRILNYMNKTPIPAGIGGTANPPPWREKSNTLGWAQWQGPQEHGKNPPTALSIIKGALNHENDPVVYICLGPLTNLAELLAKDKHSITKISRVLYFGNAPSSENRSWNTMR
ncbi:MAG: hypothetical protein GF350_15640, partial [Chitinivibrionales bacterium]|nr:hypothetical protein [Chitinivibrionales bacterium]